MRRGMIFIFCAIIFPLPFLNGMKGSNYNFKRDIRIFDIASVWKDPALCKDLFDEDLLDEDLAFPVGQINQGGEKFYGQENNSYISQNLFEDNFSSANNNSSVVDEVINPNANAEGRYGLVNHGNICYMSAFISSVFNVPFFREAVYASEPKTASAFMLAQVFAKMQNAKGPINTVNDLIPAVEKNIGWKFGSMECIMEFIVRFLDIIAETDIVIKKTFALEVRERFYRLDNRVVLKSKTTSGDSYQVVHPTSESVSAAIFSKFPYTNRVSYTIEPENCDEYTTTVPEYNGTKIEIETIRETEIINRPKLMIFGIPRTSPRDESFNSKEMKLDFEILMPPLEKVQTGANVVNVEDGEEQKGERQAQDVKVEYEAPVNYLLNGFCVYIPGHYISYVRDFSKGSIEGDWYIYNDSTVSPVRTRSEYNRMLELANTSATLAFYVRSDAIDRNVTEIPVPARYLRLANLQFALEEVIQMRSKQVASEVPTRDTCSLSPARSVSPLSNTRLPDLISPNEFEDWVLPNDCRAEYSKHFPRDQDFIDFSLGEELVSQLVSDEE